MAAMSGRDRQRSSTMRNPPDLGPKMQKKKQDLGPNFAWAAAALAESRTQITRAHRTDFRVSTAQVARGLEFEIW